LVAIVAPTLRFEGLIEQSLIRAVMKAPCALGVIAVGYIPALISAETAFERINGRAAYDLSSGGIICPVSLFVHGVYLSCMYSEGEQEVSPRASPQPLYHYYTTPKGAIGEHNVT